MTNNLHFVSRKPTSRLPDQLNASNTKSKVKEKTTQFYKISKNVVKTILRRQLWFIVATLIPYKFILALECELCCQLPLFSITGYKSHDGTRNELMPNEVSHLSQDPCRSCGLIL